MAIYKCSWEVEPGTTRIKFNEWLERVLNPGSPDLKASALTTGPHCLNNCLITDDVSKNVRKDRAKLRKDYLKGIKERSDVEFAFIPWSVPAQILFKDRNCSKLKSFKLPE